MSDSVHAMNVPAINRFHLGSWGLAPLLCLACAGTVTPPDTTPVYADDATQGVEPIPVEHASVNDPEVQISDSAPGQTKAEKAPNNEAAPADPKGAPQASAATGVANTEDAPDVTEEAPSQPVVPAEPKKTPAPTPKAP